MAIKITCNETKITIVIDDEGIITVTNLEQT